MAWILNYQCWSESCVVCSLHMYATAVPLVNHKLWNGHGKVAWRFQSCRVKKWHTISFVLRHCCVKVNRSRATLFCRRAAVTSFVTCFTDTVCILNKDWHVLYHFWHIEKEAATSGTSRMYIWSTCTLEQDNKYFHFAKAAWLCNKHTGYGIREQKYLELSLRGEKCTIPSVQLKQLMPNTTSLALRM